ncbi:MAG TPA: D-2-hydroxyacid dehydrogenase [Nannocystaceae bacterium]|nr:D-2-hydroxyacid dehydrogenase [Nannocystaceae bacterium]
MSAIEVIHVLHAHRRSFARAIATLAIERRIVLLETPDELAACIGEVEVLLASHPPQGSWARAQRLRLLHLAGVGAESLLPAPDLHPAVRIAGARDLFADEAAEHVIATMLALLRGLPTLVDRQRRGEWLRHEVERASGKIIGILGLGAIGGRVARVARALGMRVLATRRRPAPHEHADEVWPPSRTRDVLAHADVVVVTLPSTPQTRGLIDPDALACCRRGALLVDVARGGIVDEDALVRALLDGHLAGAALDVFEHEPLDAASPLWRVPNLLVTPHLAGYGRDYVARLLVRVLANVDRLERGEPLLGEVDRDAGY